jgi:predicted GTPase
VTSSDPALLRGKRVLVIEDGPTLTHGGMRYGAGIVAARQAGAAEIIDPRPYAVGSIRQTYEKYPNAAGILPAMGYGEQQVRELEETIRRTPADVVVAGTPIDLTRILKLDIPAVKVRYELRELVPGTIEQAVRNALAGSPVDAWVQGQ